MLRYALPVIISNFTENVFLPLL